MRHSMTYGVMPEFEAFQDAFYEKVGYHYYFGNDPIVGTDSLTYIQLWALLNKIACLQWAEGSDYHQQYSKEAKPCRIPLDGYDAKELLQWASDVLGTLGFEWV